MYKTIKLIVLPLALASLGPWSVGAAQAPAATNAPVAAKPALKATDLFPDAVVVKGKGIEIKRSQLDQEVSRFKAEQAAQGRPVQSEDSTAADRFVLEQMLRVKMLAAKATDADKAAAKTRAEKRFAEAQTRLGAEVIDRELKLLDTTPTEMIAKWTELGCAEEVVKREVKVSASDAEVKQYFEDNQAKFEQPEMLRASHILLATQDMTASHTELSAEKKAAKHKEAEEILKRARAGEDFAKLAKEHSEDPGSAKRGGEYLFTRGQMMKEFEDAAFALNTNQVSDIVTTSYGYHIIKLSEKVPARKAGLDDEVTVAQAGYIVLKQYSHDPEVSTNAVKVSTLIRQTLEGKQFQKEMPGYMEKLRKDLAVEILDEKLKPEPSASTSGSAAPEPAAADKPKAK
jgi:hypothetical protein